LPERFAFGVCVRLGFCLRDGVEDDRCNNAADDRIDREKVEDIDVCDETTDGWSDDS